MKWVILSCCVLFIVCVIFLASGIAAKLNNEKNYSALSFLVQNAHTGLISAPAVQVALNDQSNGNQYASNSGNPTQNEQNGSRQVAVNTAVPPVLFDVSVQPLFQKNNIFNILLWLAVFVLILLFVENLIYKAYKKTKLKKIKKN